jgi:hypothetical protein
LEKVISIFLVEDKIIIELKRNDIFSKKHIDQVLNYLKISNLKLALLIHFSKEGVKYKRILMLNKFITIQIHTIRMAAIRNPYLLRIFVKNS